MKITKLIFIFLLIQLSACDNKEQQRGAVNEGNTVKYARHLTIQPHKTYTLITVQPANDQLFKYVLYKDLKPEIAGANAFIQVPLKSIACTSTSQLPAFNLLNSPDKLIGFQGTKWIYNNSLKQRTTTGLLKDIGQKQGINQELVLSLQPDVLMAYQLATGTNTLSILQQTGIEVVYNVDYTESSPLGRAEWLKFTAALLDKNELADSIFKVIEANYLQLKHKANAFERKPTVMTGVMYGDTWYVPGGNNYSSQFIKDAGGAYIWANDSSTASLALGFENVLSKAKNADLWIGTASIDTYDALAQTDERYTYFKPYDTRSIYSYTKKVNELGSNDYLESGYARPDYILADYIKMMHPESDTAKTLSYTYFEALK